MNKNKKLFNKIFLIILMLILITLTILILTGVTLPFDEYIMNSLINIRTDVLSKTICSVTNLGGGYALSAISILLLIVLKNKKNALMIIINLIVVFLTSQLLKVIFARPRPNVIALISETGYSYPSGHTMVSTAFYLFLAYLICKNAKSKFIKIFSVIISITLIVVIGFSRLYLGVHYFTDVIGGILFAVTYLYCFIMLWNRIRGKK